MKTVLIYAFVALCVSTEFVYTKEIFDLVVDTSGGGIPVANDKHYNFYVKDYFGLINGYADKTNKIKNDIEHDYDRWSNKLLKSNPEGMDLLNSAYMKVIEKLTEYQNDVLMKYHEITPIAIVDIVGAVNHMRQSQNSFYTRIKLNSHQCQDFSARNMYYKWEKPALYCIYKKITRALALQLQYTYDINVYYAQVVDEIDSFVKYSDGNDDEYITIDLEAANEELWSGRASQIKSIEILLKDEQTCAAASYRVFEKLKKSFTEKASECF